MKRLLGTHREVLLRIVTALGGPSGPEHWVNDESCLLHWGTYNFDLALPILLYLESEGCV